MNTMSPHIKTRNQGRSSAVLLIVVVAITLFIAFFAEIKFDLTVLGYFLLVLSSPVLVLFASDVRQMRKA
jgi:hypothetical protein